MASPHRQSLIHRSTSLSKGSSCASGDLFYQFENNIVLIGLLVAALVAIVTAWAVGPRYATAAATNKWNPTLSNAPLAGASLLVALGAAAWVTAHSYKHAEGRNTLQMALLALYALVGAAVIAICCVFFRRDQRDAAFYMSIGLAVALAVHSYLAWTTMGPKGVVGMIPIVLVCAFFLWAFWPKND